MIKRLQKPPSKQSFFLLGPRGTGKSTWLKEQFKADLVIDLLSSTQYLAYKNNPHLLSEKVLALPKGSKIIIDEIQKIPELLDEVHALIFEKHNYQFALTGSSARKLKRSNANMLAGRAINKRFFPLLVEELVAAREDTALEKILQFGSLPESITTDDTQEKIEYLSAYVETYLKEEIQQEALTRNLDQFMRFLKVSALTNAQITNWSSIARDAHTSRSTVVGYYEIVLDTLLGWTLPAYQAKAKIKEVSHPKFYWFDTGVLRTLQNLIHEPLDQTEKGVLFETLVCNEARAINSILSIGAELYYWRTESGNEVDLIVKRGKKAIGIEIKAKKNWKKEDQYGLQTLLDEKKITTALGIYLGDDVLQITKDIKVIPLKQLTQELTRFFPPLKS
jgi:predicted AAA+ superfamily ATPase